MRFSHLRIEAFCQPYRIDARYRKQMNGVKPPPAPYSAGESPRQRGLFGVLSLGDTTTGVRRYAAVQAALLQPPAPTTLSCRKLLCYVFLTGSM